MVVYGLKITAKEAGILGKVHPDAFPTGNLTEEQVGVVVAIGVRNHRLGTCSLWSEVGMPLLRIGINETFMGELRGANKTLRERYSVPA